jgi:hypothetical protein
MHPQRAHVPASDGTFDVNCWSVHAGSVEIIAGRIPCPKYHKVGISLVRFDLSACLAPWRHIQISGNIGFRMPSQGWKHCGIKMRQKSVNLAATVTNVQTVQKPAESRTLSDGRDFSILARPTSVPKKQQVYYRAHSSPLIQQRRPPGTDRRACCMDCGSGPKF